MSDDTKNNICPFCRFERWYIRNIFGWDIGIGVGLIIVTIAWIGVGK